MFWGISPPHRVSSDGAQVAPKGDNMAIFAEDLTVVRAVLAQYPNASVNAFLKADNSLCYRIWVKFEN